MPQMRVDRVDRVRVPSLVLLDPLNAAPDSTNLPSETKRIEIDVAQLPQLRQLRRDLVPPRHLQYRLSLLLAGVLVSLQLMKRLRVARPSLISHLRAPPLEVASPTKTTSRGSRASMFLQ